MEYKFVFLQQGFDYIVQIILTPPPTHTHTTPLVPMIFGLLILKMRGLIKSNNDNEFLHVNVKEHLLKIYYINLLN